MSIDIAALECAELQSRLDNVICNLIRMHVGKPCPTRRDIMYVSTLPRRRVWKYLDDMQVRGLIEIQVCASAPALRRRMRVAGGQWTLWTDRESNKRRGRTGAKIFNKLDGQLALVIEEICRQAGAIYDCPSPTVVRNIMYQHGLKVRSAPPVRTA